MSEFLNQLTTSDLFVAVIAFLTANAGTIIGFIIYAVKQGLKRTGDQAAFRAECEQYVAEAKQVALDTIEELKKTVQDLEFKVVDKIDTTEEAKRQAIEAQKLELTAAIDAAKQNLTLDDIIQS